MIITVQQQGFSEITNQNWKNIKPSLQTRARDSSRLQLQRSSLCYAIDL